MTGWALQGGGEPGFEFAGGSQQIDLGLLGLEVGVEDGDEFLALGDAGVLLVFGGHLGAGEVAAAGLQLDDEDIELLLGELLVEGGDLGARGEFGRGVVGAEAAVEELIANHVGFVQGVGGVGHRLPLPWRDGPCRRREW